MPMKWIVKFHPVFEPEFDRFSESIQDEILVHAKLLERFGPTLSRPHVDTLKGSHYQNMKELRFQFDKAVWRVAFAFDPKRHAILLIAGNKTGKNQKLFYKNLIRQADLRFAKHLTSLEVLGHE